MGCCWMFDLYSGSAVGGTVMQLGVNISVNPLDKAISERVILVNASNQLESK